MIYKSKIPSYYKKTALTSLRVEYNGEIIKINLPMELKISEAIISTEIKNQPSKYGFLLLLHKKLLTAFEEAKLKRGKVIGMLTLEGKEKLQPHTNRPFTDDMVKAWVESHKKYLEASQACIAAKDAADAIYACVKGFEQRKDLLQTLSSNQRNER